ncbi:MAG: invasion associated locus B family protein [Rhizobiaceae bacterium]|nr:invasion associated locus B family protein [Rhizobiaceae bacterium]
MTSKFNTSILMASAAVLGTLMLLPVSEANAQNAPRSKGWYKVCSEQNETKICNTQYQAVAGTGQVVTSVNLAEITGKVKRRVFQITVPTGRLIPPGIIMQVDSKKGAKLPYVYCVPRNCAAEVKLDDNLVQILKNGGELTVISTNVQNKQNPIKITLSGFTAAYDGPPLKQDELQTKQKELQTELRKKADATRKKLQEAQEAAKKAN